MNPLLVPLNRRLVSAVIILFWKALYVGLGYIRADKYLIKFIFITQPSTE